MSAEDVVFKAFENHWRSKVAYALADVRPYTESPIEEIMGASLLIGLQEFAARLSLAGNLPMYVQIGQYYVESDAPRILIVPQFGWESYRIDFAIFATALASEAKLFVECDGHDFHERTKEQAARDRAKDRRIQEAGIAIYRFTGREIYRDPEGCVVQVMDLITNKLIEGRK